MRSTLLCLSLVGLSACGPITFTAGLKGEATLAGSPLGNLLSVFPQVGNFSNLDFNQNQDFKNNNAARERVKSMTVTSFTIRISSPNNQDFDFLDSLEFFAKTDGQPEAKIAGKLNISSLNLVAPNPTLVMDLEPVDLSPYVRASTMSITVKGTGRQPPQDTTLAADGKFLVGLGL